MYNIRIFSILACCMCSILLTKAQDKTLKIGDTVPDVTIRNTINYPAKDLIFSCLQGKFIILDFWNKHCTSCVKSFPKLERLQKDYGDKLQIILVNAHDSKKDALKFLKTNKIAKSVTLPIVLEDTLFKNYFPHSGEPHLVWIDTNRVVKAITESGYLLEKNIIEFTSSKNLNWQEKKLSINVGQGNSLIGIVDDKLRWEAYEYNFISQNIDRLRVDFSYTVDSSKHTRKLTAINTSISELYRISFARKLKRAVYKNRIVLSVNDTTKFIHNPDYESRSAWSARNTFCHEFLTSMKTSEEGFFQEAIEFYNRYFKLDADLDSIFINCNILVQSRTPRLSSLEKSGWVRPVKYNSVKDLLHTLNWHPHNPIFLAELRDLKDFNITLNEADLTNREALKKSLAKQGYELIEQRRKLEMLVIKDYKQVNK